MKIVIDDYNEGDFPNDKVAVDEVLEPVINLECEDNETYDEFINKNIGEKNLSNENIPNSNLGNKGTYKVESKGEGLKIVLDGEGNSCNATIPIEFEEVSKSQGNEVKEKSFTDHINQINKNKVNNSSVSKGKIRATVKLNDKNGVEISGAKVNLYSISNLNPKLCQSNVTDNSGNVLFNNLENGCYRVIALVDRKFFDKPTYCNWNEFNIDYNAKEGFLTIVLKIKDGLKKK